MAIEEKEDKSYIRVVRFCGCRREEARSCQYFEGDDNDCIFHRNNSGECAAPKIAIPPLDKTPYTPYVPTLSIRLTDIPKLERRWHWMLDTHTPVGWERDEILLLIREATKRAMELTKEIEGE